MWNLDPFQSGKTLEAVGQEGFSSVRHQQDLSQNVGKWDKHKKKWWRRRGVRSLLLSPVGFFATTLTVDGQAPLFIGFLRQEY